MEKCSHFKCRANDKCTGFRWSGNSVAFDTRLAHSCNICGRTTATASMISNEQWTVSGAGAGAKTEAGAASVVWNLQKTSTTTRTTTLLSTSNIIINYCIRGRGEVFYKYLADDLPLCFVLCGLKEFRGSSCDGDNDDQ